MPSDAAREVEHRLHAWSVLFSLLSQIRQFAVPILLALFVGSRGNNFEVYALPILLPYSVLVVLRYVSTRYVLLDGELIIRSGLVFKNERHVPYSRVQNVDAVQTALHRLLGVVDVRIDTGGGGDTDAKLSVVTLPAFDEVRRRVMSGRAGAASAPAGSPAGAETPAPAATQAEVLLHLPSRELALFGAIENRAAVAIAAAMGLAYDAGLFERVQESLFGEGTAGRGAIRRAIVAVFRDNSAPLDLGQVAWGAGIIAGLILVVRLVSMGWAMVRLHDFRLTRSGTDLQTRYGLLTRVSATVPLHRIQTLTVRRGLLHAWTGRVTVKVETAGGDGVQGRSRRRESLAPIIRPEALPALLQEILPGLDLTNPDWQPPAPRALRREIAARSILAVVASLPFAYWLGAWSAVVLAAFILWGVVAARIYVAHLRWAVIDGAVLQKSGWIWSRLSVARFTKVQAVSMRQSPFDRRHRMAVVSVDTAGSVGAPDRVSVPYVPLDVATNLHGHLAMQAARSEFRW